MVFSATCVIVLLNRSFEGYKGPHSETNYSDTKNLI